MIQAKVKWFNKQKGFGIAELTESNQEIFIHYSNLILMNDNIRGYLVENEMILLENIKKDDKNRYVVDKIKPLDNLFICEKENNHYHQTNDKNKINKNKIKRNTQDFKPNYDNPDMKILVSTNTHNYDKDLSSRDIVLIPNLFIESQNIIYDKLLNELNNINDDKLWKSWHENNHLIADDHLGWKKHSSTFNMIISKIEEYFNMDIKATRLNWYKDTSDWKPFHHDAAAVKKDKAKTQNFTIGVSFGYEREICFEHAKNKNKVSFLLSNGMTYGFSRNINVEWRHGILPIHPDNYKKQGRISIIAWGKVNLID